MRNPIIVQACTGYPPDRIGGVEKIVSTLNDSINQNGLKCIVVTRFWKKKIDHPTVIQIKTPSRESLGYFIWTLKALALIRKLKPNIVHCHGLEGALICIALHPTRIKRIMHIHNSITREPGYSNTVSHKLGLIILKLAIVLADLSVCPSNASKRDIAQYASKQVMVKAVVVPNFAQEPVAVSEDEINDTRIKYGLSDKKVILYFGKIKSTKGIENICKAYRIMSLRQNSRLVLAGMPTATDRFLQKLKNSYPEVIFTGYVDNPSVFYRIADVFCIYTTSFGGGETFAITLADAMRHGVPIVTSDNPIYREVTNNLAIYAKPDDPENLAHTLDFALQNRDILYKNAIIAKKYADNVYNEKNFVRSILMTYRSVLEPK
jgi:glycosyltransferase involved in cell wall biosynthesis